ncbi:MAG: CvpA family protein [Holosporales bacterium]|jgi:membrane protein required for colicin V production|nr:CvpA family protein [Holosporales bacterium]
MNINDGLLSVDTFILIAIFISVLFGFFRGVTKEILSLISWVGSVALTILAFPYAKNIARANIEHGLIADFVSACVLFVLFLTLLSILNYICSNFIKQSVLSGVDRFLGGVFGILRGIIIVAIIDMMVGQWLISDKTPDWINDSKFRPHIIKIANLVILMLPESIQKSLVSHMSSINKENLLKFIVDDISTQTDLGISEIKDEIAKVEATPSTNNNSDSQIEAEKLATLKPKENTSNDKQTIVSSKTSKEKLDMSRVLDQGTVDE